MNMIELISPKEISKEERLIDKFKTFGIDYFDIDSNLGWNYALDHIWLYKKISEYIENKNLSDPIVWDIGCGNSPFHNFIEKDLKIRVIGFDRPQGFCHQEQLINADYLVEFEKFRDVKENSVDIIYWLSAIEHNKEKTIRNLYKKSLKFLKIGGLLLITFPISKEHGWFEESQQTNFSLEKARLVFNEKNIIGDFDNIHKEFRENYLLLRDKHKKRYGRFYKEDPLFIVGGLEQFKEKRNIFGL